MTEINSASLNYIKRLGTPIAALASGLGGPVAIIRVSGEDLSFLEKTFGSFPKAGEHGLRKLRSFALENETILDEVLLLNFQAPNSFTGENVLEIQGHGVPALVESILKELQRLGCEPALPGEFSFRAVWNDKMSLEEASRLQMLFANEGLGSSSASKLLSFSKSHDENIQNALSECLDKILKARGRVEAAIDFAEAEEEQAEDIASASERISAVQNTLTALLNTYETFVQNASVPQVILAGPPNAGKSTLLNLLCGSERSIVSNIAGTTRDYVEVALKTPKGRSFKLVDTAGIRELVVQNSSDFQTPGDTRADHENLESKGIQKGLELIEKAQILFWVQDARDPEEDVALKKIRDQFPTLKIVSFFSHADLLNSSDTEVNSVLSRAKVFSFTKDTSALNDAVLDEVDRLQSEREKNLDLLSQENLISQRQKKLIDEVKTDLLHSQECLDGFRPLELVGDHLRDSEFKLRQVLGQELGEDYIGEIFSQFCLGK